MKKGQMSILAALLLVAVHIMPASALGAGHHQSGITGEAVLYRCAVVNPTSQCYEPYQSSIKVTTDTGRFITRVPTDASGHFQVFLKRGDYVLQGDTAGNLFYPYARPVTVHVNKKSFTSATIVFDSGIR